MVDDREVTRTVPIGIRYNPGNTALTADNLCSLFVRADHAYIAARLVIQTQYPGLQIGMFLAAHTTELYLKAAIVSASGALPENLGRGAKGHDLRVLATHLVSLGHLVDFFDAERVETLRRLTPMTMAGRYPNAQFWFSGGMVTDFLWWLDELVHTVRETFARPVDCRDEVEEVRANADFTGHEVLVGARAAAREALFFQNKEFDGWWMSEGGRPVLLDGTPWTTGLAR